MRIPSSINVLPAAALALTLSGTAEAGKKGEDIIDGLRTSLTEHARLCELDKKPYRSFNLEGPRSAAIFCDSGDQKVTVQIDESFITVHPISGADIRLHFKHYTDPDLLGDRKGFRSANDTIHNNGFLYLDVDKERCWRATQENPRLTRTPYTYCEEAYELIMNQFGQQAPEVLAAFNNNPLVSREVPAGKGFTESLAAEVERIDRFCWGEDRSNSYHDLTNIHGQKVMKTGFSGDGLSCAVSVTTMADGVSRLVQATSGDQTGSPRISVSFNRDGMYTIGMSGSTRAEFILLERNNGNCTSYDDSYFMFGRGHPAEDCNRMLEETLRVVSGYLDRTLPIPEGHPFEATKAKMQDEIQRLGSSED